MSSYAKSANASVPDSFFTASLAQADPEIAGAIKNELGRQQHEIELIASENIVSRAVLEAQGSIMTSPKRWRSSAPRSCSARTSPTSSRIPAAR